MLCSKGMKQSYFDEISQVLNLNFRYPSITRDMGYIECLVDTMLRVPVEHALAASYLADRYDAKAIAERLDAHDAAKHAHLVYQSERDAQQDRLFRQCTTPQRFAEWQQLGAGISLALPAMNPYIPDSFTLTKPSREFKKPQRVVDQQGLRVLYMPSRYFADEPKSDVTVALRNANAMNYTRNQVLFSLTDYLAGIALDQLSYQV